MRVITAMNRSTGIVAEVEVWVSTIMKTPWLSLEDTLTGAGQDRGCPRPVIEIIKMSNGEGTTEKVVTTRCHQRITTIGELEGMLTVEIMEVLVIIDLVLQTMIYEKSLTAEDHQAVRIAGYMAVAEGITATTSKLPKSKPSLRDFKEIRSILDRITEKTSINIPLEIIHETSHHEAECIIRAEQIHLRIGERGRHKML